MWPLDMSKSQMEAMDVQNGQTFLRMEQNSYPLDTIVICSLLCHFTNFTKWRPSSTCTTIFRIVHYFHCAVVHLKQSTQLSNMVYSGQPICINFLKWLSIRHNGNETYTVFIVTNVHWKLWMRADLWELTTQTGTRMAQCEATGCILHIIHFRLKTKGLCAWMAHWSTNIFKYIEI